MRREQGTGNREQGDPARDMPIARRRHPRISAFGGSVHAAPSYSCSLFPVPCSLFPTKGLPASYAVVAA